MITPSTVSLWDMLEINAQSFMNSVMEMRRVQAIIEHSGTDEGRRSLLDDSSKGRVTADLEDLLVSIQELYARATYIAAKRFLDLLATDEAVTWIDLKAAMADIESRLRDELGLVQLFVLDPANSVYLQPGQALMGDLISDRFPSVLFEMEEAAKCLAMSRATASAFHSMRALEVALKALGAFLEIGDPVKGTDRNWGTVLTKIKTKMDEKYPNKGRLPGTVGTVVEGVYMTLDAVKNPWRNATMHTENTYQPFEASHILQAVNAVFIRLAGLCDEDGQLVP